MRCPDGANSSIQMGEYTHRKHCVRPRQPRRTMKSQLLKLQASGAIARQKSRTLFMMSEYPSTFFWWNLRKL